MKNPLSTTADIDALMLLANTGSWNSPVAKSLRKKIMVKSVVKGALIGITAAVVITGVSALGTAIAESIED